MSRIRCFDCCSMALGLAAVSILACNSDTGKTVPGGQPCKPGDECEVGWFCYQEVCRQICNDHQECAKTEACEPGVCVPVANYECDEDADCNEPPECQSILDVECYAGRCHYSPLAEGLPCDDENKCTSNDQCDSAGNCNGEAMVCDAPPANFCSQDDSMFRRYANPGTCNPTHGLCEYEYEDIACADCGRQCLGLPHAPANLVASAGDAKVTLTWDAIDGALSYNVYMSQTAGNAASAGPVSVTGSSHVHTSLENGSTYYFAVSAVVGIGEGDLSAEVSATPRISAPQQVSAQGDDHRLTLTWEPVPGADTYNVYWALQAGVTMGSNKMSNVTSPFVHAPLSNNTTYYYALTAVDGPSESVLSDEVSVNTVVDDGTELVGPGTGSFGNSVGLSGDYAIVGGSASGDGAAYVFYRTGDNNWGTRTELVGPGNGDFVVLSGDYAIVGVETGGYASPPYVFHRTGDNNWDTGTELVGPAGVSFGFSVGLSGDYAIVGAPAADSQAGAAYVFYRTGDNNWDTGTKLVSPDPPVGSCGFGLSVALGGDYAIVGSGCGAAGGAAYVFHRTSGNTWDTGTKLVATDPQTGDDFGRFLAVSGDYAIVGAKAEDGGDGDPLDNAGAAYLFHRTGENMWDTGIKLVVPDAQAGDEFGCSVAISGDYAIVGAKLEDGGDGDPLDNAGAAYLFHRTGENMWDTGIKLVAPDARAAGYFGHSVAASGNYAIVAGNGAAYVYEY